MLAVTRRPWLRVLVAGATIWELLDWATVTSRNVSLVPSLILVGASLGPVVFSAFVCDRAREVPGHVLLWCFIVGGALGVIAASVIEYRTLLDLGALPTLLVAVIE